MSDTSFAFTVKCGSGKKRKHRTFSGIKAEGFGQREVADEPWVSKRKKWKVYVSSPAGSVNLIHGRVDPIDEPQLASAESLELTSGPPIQLTSSQYLKMSELSFGVSDVITRHTQRMLEVMQSSIRLTMSEFQIQHPVVNIPELKTHDWTWAFPRLTAQLSWQAGTIQQLLGQKLQTSLLENDTPSPVVFDDTWLERSDSLLAHLESGQLSETDQRRAISHAESLAFSTSEKERLLTFYDQFIEASRFTEDEDEITAVCAAIRKYAMNMATGRLKAYANWMSPSAVAGPHHDIELELAKGAYWHLRYLDVEGDENLRDLQVALASVASDYLRPRLMLDKNYASIEKFAVIACILIDARLGKSDVSIRLWSAKCALAMGWFDRLVNFELSKALQTLGKRDEDFALEINKLIEVLKSEGE